MWSWAARHRRITLAGQFLAFQLVVLALVLVTVAVVSVRQSTAEFTRERGQRIAGAAEDVAATPVVRDFLDAPDAARLLAPSVVQAQRLSGSDDVAVARPDGTIVASTDPGQVGTAATLGASDVQDGRGWSGRTTDATGAYLNGHAPVQDTDTGDFLGFAVVREEFPTVQEQLLTATPNLLLFLGIGAGLGGAGSWLLSRLIRRRTRGLEPEQIATLADHREALLYSIREGVVGVSPHGTITVLNDSARELLDLPADSVGRAVDDLDLEPEVARVLAGGDDEAEAVVVSGTRVLVLNRRRASSQGQQVGTVTTLRDRTELVSLQSQLSSTRSVTETLRAQTHEFANQLHTISGLVQLEEYDQVSAFIGNLTRRRAAISAAVTDAVDDPTVAALLVAKASLAAESGVELSLTDDSRLPRLPGDVSTDVTTVLGNLVDNAVDATPPVTGACVRIRLRLRLGDDGTAVLVEVRDEGRGVPQDLADRIFVRGFSTKPAGADGQGVGGRGIGLALVSVVCAQRGGSVSVRNDGGAVFSAELPY